jgi:hypothetical protein
MSRGKGIVCAIVLYMVPEPLFSSEIMASSSSSSPVINTLSHAVSKKLIRDNFHLWKAQVWPAMRGA